MAEWALWMALLGTASLGEFPGAEENRVRGGGLSEFAALRVAPGFVEAYEDGLRGALPGRCQASKARFFSAWDAVGQSLMLWFPPHLKQFMR